MAKNKTRAESRWERRIIIMLFVIVSITICFHNVFYRNTAKVEHIDNNNIVCIDTTGNVWDLEKDTLQVQVNDIIQFHTFNMFTAEKHDDIPIIESIHVNNNIDFCY